MVRAAYGSPFDALNDYRRRLDYYKGTPSGGPPPMRKTHYDSPWAPSWDPGTDIFSESVELEKDRASIEEQRAELTANLADLKARGAASPDVAAAADRLQQQLAVVDADAARLQAHTIRMANQLPNYAGGQPLLGPEVTRYSEKASLVNLTRGGGRVGTRPEYPAVNVPTEVKRASNDGGGEMAGQGVAALQALGSTGETYWDRMRRQAMEEAKLREQEAMATKAEAETPRGLAETRERQLNETIANLRTGRAGFVAGGTADIQNDLARRQALSAAETTFLSPVAEAAGVAHGRKLEEIRAGKVEPANVTGAWRAQAQGIESAGAGERAALAGQTDVLVALLNDYTRASTNLALSDADRMRMQQAADSLRNVLASMGVELTGGPGAAVGGGRGGR